MIGNASGSYITIKGTLSEANNPFFVADCDIKSTGQDSIEYTRGGASIDGKSIDASKANTSFYMFTKLEGATMESEKISYKYQYKDGTMISINDNQSVPVIGFSTEYSETVNNLKTIKSTKNYTITMPDGKHKLTYDYEITKKHIGKDESGNQIFEFVNGKIYYVSLDGVYFKITDGIKNLFGFPTV